MILASNTDTDNILISCLIQICYIVGLGVAKLGSETIDKLFDVTNNLLRNKMDNLMLMFHETQAGFYNGYQKARTIVGKVVKHFLHSTMPLRKHANTPLQVRIQKITVHNRNALFRAKAQL